MEDGSVVLQEESREFLASRQTSFETTQKSDKIENSIDDNDLDLQMMVDPAIINSQKMELERIERLRSQKLISEKEIYQIHPTGNDFSDYNPIVADPLPAARPNAHSDDWLFARALQAMEFEITNEMIEGRNGDFDAKEYSASRSCKRQMLTLSTFICVVQIGLMIAMIQVGGWAPRSQNPMFGPPPYILVKFGAKETALIVDGNILI